MSDTPPFFTLTGDTPGIGAPVLLVGRPTVPLRILEADGGDPEGWSGAISHTTLKTWNQEIQLTVTISGTFSTNRERIYIVESGDAASCARKVTETTGTSASTEFSFVDTITIPKHSRLAIADTRGTVGNGASGSVSSTSQTDNAVLQDKAVSTALCGSSGCTSGDLPNYDNGGTYDMVTEWGPGTYLETVARKENTETYRYKFEYHNFVTFQSGAIPVGINDRVEVFIYTGVFHENRYNPTIPDGYSLSEEATVGTVRGATLKARYLAFDHNHAQSIIAGTAGLCPVPLYSSDVTTGNTVGTITAVVA